MLVYEPKILSFVYHQMQPSILIFCVIIVVSQNAQSVPVNCQVDLKRIYVKQTTVSIYPFMWPSNFSLRNTRNNNVALLYIDVYFV